MTFKKKLIKHNRSGEKLKPLGIVLHETATPNASAESEYKYFNSAERNASAHGFVDWDEYIQTIPYDEVGWHAGYSANHKYIGIEMCHATNQADFNKVWANALEVCGKILTDLGLTAENIATHNDMSILYHETDHTDPIGYFRSYGKTFQDFKADLSATMEDDIDMTKYEELKNEIETLKKKVESVTYIYDYIDKNMPSWATDTVKKLVDKGYLKGDENGKLNLNQLMMRILVILDRVGVFG